MQKQSDTICSALGGVDYCTRSCQTTAIDQTGLHTTYENDIFFIKFLWFM